MTVRSMVIVPLATLLLAASPAGAQQAKCLALKTKCMSKKAAGLLKCHARAETPGKPTDPNTKGCVDKAVAKFDGGSNPPKGCFEKFENKPGNDCISFDDTGEAEAAVDACVDGLVAAIDPPPLDQTRCGAGKKKCASKLLAGLLKCQQAALTPGKSSDPNAKGCVDKATAKYTGGTTPAKGCFAKLESKAASDCQNPGDSASVQGLIESCVDSLVDLVANPPTTTSTTPPPPTTSTTLPGPTVLLGALTSTLGRFNYNLQLGLPGANAACDTNFAGTHACTYDELQSAEAAGDLVGLQDITANTVTAFWAIDNGQPPLQQCNDDAIGGSGLNWEYGTAHTASRGQKVALDNGAGTLGTLQSGLQCNFSGNAWVGCCQ